jgi:alkylation response protein AidB-like acyl-CoA dehydrogenase
MDFKLTEEHLMIRQTFRNFAQKEVKPLSRILDAKPDPKDCIDWNLVKKVSDLGVKVLALPEEWGGTNADIITRLIVQEELAAADIGFADLMREHGRHFAQMTKEQRDEFLPQYLADYTYFIAEAHTEPDHGTDDLTRYADPAASIQTYAEKRGDEYILNGTKHFISHAGIAKLYWIFARTDKKLHINECEAGFIVPSDTPGLTIGKFMNKMGRRLLMNAEIILEDVHVPAKYKLPGIPSAGALIICANIIGLCRCAYEETLNYARARIQGAKPIIQHQNIAVKLAEMKVKIEACRSLVWQHAWYTENNYNYDPQMYKLIKGFVNKMSVDIIHNAVDIHGGLGIDRDLPIEKYLRDVYSTLHGVGMPDTSLIRGAPTLTTD